MVLGSTRRVLQNSDPAPAAAQSAVAGAAASGAPLSCAGAAASGFTAEPPLPPVLVIPPVPPSSPPAPPVGWVPLLLLEHAARRMAIRNCAFLIEGASDSSRGQRVVAE